MEYYGIEEGDEKVKEYAFHVVPGSDDEIISALDVLTADERNSFIRKAITSYLKSIGKRDVKSKSTQRTSRPEPHGYPVE